MDDITTQLDTLAVGGLPKWPQMIVTGTPVSPSEAFDIILRTDSFLTSASQYGGGNHREFNDNYRDLAGLALLQVERKYPEGHAFIDSDWEKQEQLQKAVGVVDTAYVSNDWASSCFIFGPHGWCHPNGTIRYVDNIGKWPSLREVYDDWAKIAEAWPFLDLNVTLMSGESCEDDTEPVINFRIANGVVTVQAPDLTVHDAVESRNIVNHNLGFDQNAELGLPASWYVQAASVVRHHVSELIGRQEVGS